MLTDTGAGAAWQDLQLPAAYFHRNGGYIPLTTTSSIVLSLPVPAGRYQVSALTTAFNNAAGTSYFSCSLRSPNGVSIGERFGNLDPSVFNASLGINGLVATDGGSITLRCQLWSGAPVQVYENTIMATRVGAISGTVVSRQTAPRRSSRQP